MSRSTCARSGGAALYSAANNRGLGLYWALIEMQRDQEAIANRACMQPCSWYPICWCGVTNPAPEPT